jgi:hypothetical protein
MARQGRSSLDVEMRAAGSSRGAGSVPRLRARRSTPAGFSRSNIHPSKPQNSASAHPIKGVCNLDLIEHGQQTLHRSRRVALSPNAPADDASRMLQSLQNCFLIGSRHSLDSSALYESPRLIEGVHTCDLFQACFAVQGNGFVGPRRSSGGLQSALLNLAAAARPAAQAALSRTAPRRSSC